jgi:hypothetical protein
MPVSSNHIVTVVALALAGLALCGCASINEKVTSGVVDSIPHWAGGLPEGVPPRRGTPEYDAYMQERERKRLEPAVATDTTKPGSPSASNASAMALDPVH